MGVDVQIGKVIHYYDKIGVAVIKLTKPLQVGDEIKISGHDNEFTQEAQSLQVEHKQVEKVKAKEEVALKVDKPTKEGDILYKVAKK